MLSLNRLARCAQQMKSLQSAKYAGALCFLLACGSGASQEQVEADGRMLAELQCEAQGIQHERFKLADDIRFLEDSLIHFPSPADTLRKQRLEALKGRTEDMWLRTKGMAEIISDTLAHLHRTRYQQPEERQRLDEALQKAFAQICPAN
jgi:hypothetical protein